MRRSGGRVLRATPFYRSVRPVAALLLAKSVGVEFWGWCSQRLAGAPTVAEVLGLFTCSKRGACWDDGRLGLLEVISILCTQPITMHIIKYNSEMTVVKYFHTPLYFQILNDVNGQCNQLRNAPIVHVCVDDTRVTRIHTRENMLSTQTGPHCPGIEPGTFLLWGVIIGLVVVTQCISKVIF